MKVFSDIKISPIKLVIGVAMTIAVLIAISVLLFSNNAASEDYIDSILDFRKEKDRSFKETEESPIEDKEKFDGLTYFYPDPNYKVNAKITPIKDSAVISILRSNGKQDHYRKYCTATFTLNKKEHTVVLLIHESEKEAEYLFLPFSDLTAGRETYSGGRYIDIKMPEDNTVEIDFNLAYNPYCVYNYRFSCPLPPKENFIDAEIRAGEKLFKE